MKTRPRTACQPRMSARDAIGDHAESSPYFWLGVALAHADQGTYIRARPSAAGCQLDHRGVLVDPLPRAAGVAFKLRMELHPGQFPSVRRTAAPADQGEVLPQELQFRPRNFMCGNTIRKAACQQRRSRLLFRRRCTKAAGRRRIRRGRGQGQGGRKSRARGVLHDKTGRTAAPGSVRRPDGPRH